MYTYTDPQQDWIKLIFPDFVTFQSVLKNILIYEVFFEHFITSKLIVTPVFDGFYCLHGVRKPLSNVQRNETVDFYSTEPYILCVVFWNWKFLMAYFVNRVDVSGNNDAALRASKKTYAMRRLEDIDWHTWTLSNNAFLIEMQRPALI